MSGAQTLHDKLHLGLYRRETGFHIRAETLSAYRTRRADMVLIDLRLEDSDGITVTKQIMAVDPEARIVIVTDYDDDLLRKAALNAGACAYALKDNLPDLVRLLEPTQVSSGPQETGSR